MLSFFFSVLHKYGYLLGLWKCNVNPYGGLICVQVNMSLVYIIIIPFFGQGVNEFLKPCLTHCNPGEVSVYDQFSVIKINIIANTSWYV